MIENDDVLSWAANYSGPQFHAMLTDPPYELGFMGKHWDKSGIAFNSSTWYLLSKHLLPGAFVMAFSAARCFHRMAVAIEDAGLIIHPAIFGWCYGSGFPKATRIDTQIDKANGASREKVQRLRFSGAPALGHKGSGFVSGVEDAQVTASEPVTAAAKSWAGHRYGLQALKPALEPIIVAQKPYDGRAIASIQAHGAGALNIEAGRIPHNEEIKAMRAQTTNNCMIKQSGRYADTTELKEMGRWPANFYIDDEGAKRLNEMSGDCPVGELKGQPRTENNIYGSAANTLGKPLFYEPDAPTGASRFFYHVTKALDEAEQVYYSAKASRAERDDGLGAMPLRTKGYSGKDSGFISNEYRVDGSYIKTVLQRNIHPTIKPIDLCKWLATLLLPPAAFAPRRILIPFAGTGSEIIGALHAGWEQPYGIERESQYIEIFKGRLNAWKEIQMTLDLS